MAGKKAEPESRTIGDIPGLREAVERVSSRLRLDLLDAALRTGLSQDAAVRVVDRLPRTVLELKPSEELARYVIALDDAVEDQIIENLRPQLMDFRPAEVAINKLLEAHRGDLVRIAGQRGLPLQDAEDVVQEVSLELRRFEPRGSIAAILQDARPDSTDALVAEMKHLAVHFVGLRAIDWHRRQKNVEPLDPQTPAIHYDPIEAIYQEQRLESVRQAVERLRREQVALEARVRHSAETVPELQAGNARLQKEQKREKEENELRKEELAYWDWRTRDPDAADADFDRSRVGGYIFRIKQSLFKRIVVLLEAKEAKETVAEAKKNVLPFRYQGEHQ